MALLVTGRPAVPSGTVTISGAKNAALPVALSAILAHGTTTLRNIPAQAGDFLTLTELMEGIGVEVLGGPSSIEIRADWATYVPPPRELCQRTRYSVLLLGVLLRRFGCASVALPGGCQIGNARPIDIHLEGFAAFGVPLMARQGRIHAALGKERSGRYRLRYPSVGATLNLMLFCALGSGERELENCAREPEVEEVARFLNACGARIEGIGTDHLRIQAVPRLDGVEWTLMPDRIEAGTYAALAAMVRSNLTLRPVRPSTMSAVLEKLEQLGVRNVYREDLSALEIKGAEAPARLRPCTLTAQPYPGFPTDLQPIFAALCLRASGSSFVADTVFPDRFEHLGELRRLGACVHRTRHGAVIQGFIGRLVAAKLWCHNIRSGVACLLASLLGEGQSSLHNEREILRGYDRLLIKLRSLNIDIQVQADEIQEESGSHVL